MADIPSQDASNDRRSKKPRPDSRQVKPKPAPPSMNVTALEAVLGSGALQSTLKGDPE